MHRVAESCVEEGQTARQTERHALSACLFVWFICLSVHTLTHPIHLLSCCWLCRRGAAVAIPRVCHRASEHSAGVGHAGKARRG